MTSLRATTMLHIDWTRCDGRGLCTELIPDLLQRDTWGFPIATHANPASSSNVEIPASRLDAANDAVDMCPLVALRLIQPTRQ